MKKANAKNVDLVALARTAKSELDRLADKTRREIMEDFVIKPKILTNKEAELKKLLNEKQTARAELQRKVDELASHVKRAQEEERGLECELEGIKAERIIQNIDALIEVAEHTRTSCSDENPCNSDDCPRCTLIVAKRDGYWNTGNKLRFVIDMDVY